MHTRVVDATGACVCQHTYTNAHVHTYPHSHMFMYTCIHTQVASLERMVAYTYFMQISLQTDMNLALRYSQTSMAFECLVVCTYMFTYVQCVWLLTFKWYVCTHGNIFMCCAIHK